MFYLDCTEQCMGSALVRDILRSGYLLDPINAFHDVGTTVQLTCSRVTRYHSLIPPLRTANFTCNRVMMTSVWNFNSGSQPSMAPSCSKFLVPPNLSLLSLFHVFLCTVESNTFSLSCYHCQCPTHSYFSLMVQNLQSFMQHTNTH